MARVRKVELTSEEVKAQIASTEEQITKLTDELKALRAQKKNLTKDLAVAEKKKPSRKRRTVYEGSRQITSRKRTFCRRRSEHA